MNTSCVVEKFAQYSKSFEVCFSLMKNEATFF
jgi:hypothetical protein